MIRRNSIYFTIYKTTNIINGRYYIGVHKTNNPSDLYLGSGFNIKKAIQKYGTSKFKKEILYYVSSSQDMYAFERQIVTPELLRSKAIYNIAGGGNGTSYVSNETKSKLRDAIMHRSKEEKEKIKKKKQYSWKTSQKRKIHSDRTRKRRIEEEKNKTIKEIQEFKDKCSDIYWNRSKIEILNHASNISSGVTQWHKNKDQEKEKLRRRRISETKKKSRRKWMTNGIERKSVREKDIPVYHKKGWTMGMIKRR